MLFGVSMTSAVSAGVIMASIPAVVAIRAGSSCASASRCASRWPSPARRCGIGLLALAPAQRLGARGRRTGASMPWLGNLLVFCAVLCEAAYAVIGKSLTGGSGPSASRR